MLFTGEIGKLRALRSRWQELGKTAASLKVLGYETESQRVAADAAQLAEAIFETYVPCAVCGKLFPQRVTVGDVHSAEPMSCLCDTCQEAIDTEVRGKMTWDTR